MLADWVGGFKANAVKKEVLEKKNRTKKGSWQLGEANSFEYCDTK
jgi:hypothetical protein